MQYGIKHRITGKALFSGGYDSLKECVEAAVKAGANLTRANLTRANLTGAYLTRANLAGANLDDAYLTGANLADANLAGANLAGANLADANLADAYLARAYLTRAYLTGANLAGADLADANLAGANLAGANLADAYLTLAERKPSHEWYAERAARYRSRNPDVPVIEGLDAKLLTILNSGAGALNMKEWHTRETTHCRAGWAVTLAGEAGRALEAKIGPQIAGTMIYLASTGRVPDFYASGEDTLEDIRKQAEIQGQSP